MTNSKRDISKPAKPVEGYQFSIPRGRSNMGGRTVKVPAEVLGKIDLTIPSEADVEKYMKITVDGDPLASAPIPLRDQGEILPPRQRKPLGEDDIGTSDKIVYPSIFDVVYKNNPNESGFTYELENQEEVDNAREFFDKKWREAKEQGNELLAMMYKQGRDYSYGKMNTKIVRRSVR